MSVYVDALFTAVPRDDTPLARQTRRHGTQWCHLFADTREELGTVADTIGLKQHWVQIQHGPALTHYDLIPSKRATAIRAGATEIQTANFIRNTRANASNRESRA